MASIVSELRLFEALRRTASDLERLDVPFAIAGGIAVSTRVEPRFTRDIDLAIAVESDAAAEQVVHALVARGYEVCAVVEQERVGRFSTARLTCSDQPSIFVDLLFASCGIEPEIVETAEEMTVGGVRVRVATVGHLIAMKVLAQESSRPQDRADLAALFQVASAEQLELAARALGRIEERGFGRGNDLLADLSTLRAELRGD